MHVSVHTPLAKHPMTGKCQIPGTAAAVCAHAALLAMKPLQVCDAGALVQSVEQDDRLDSAVVSFLVMAQEHIMVILTPPTTDSPQPLTLALLQARTNTRCFVAAVASHIPPPISITVCYLWGSMHKYHL